MVHQKYLRRQFQEDHDEFDQTSHKHFEYDNSTSLNINRKSKMIKNYCDGSCKLHEEHDEKKLIKFGYLLGFRRCSLCGYFKTILVNCPCCNRRMRGKMRQKNHPLRKFITAIPIIKAY